MHAYIIFALSHWGMTNCDQLVHGKGGGGHVVPNDPNSPSRGSFQDMLYDKPWYRPGYFIGVLGACLYVDLRDPDSKAVKKLPLWQLFLFWAVQIVLFVYSSVGNFAAVTEE